MAVVKIMAHGQITIPKKIRDTLGIKKGDLAEAEILGDQVVITPKKLVKQKALVEQQPPKTGAEVIKEMAIDKRPLAEGFRKLMDRMGIPEKPTMTLKELRESMVRGGIRPEDNEFSRAIIEEREK
jgi:AbrB family looped-hinge helix DNA binding protein